MAILKGKITVTKDMNVVNFEVSRGARALYMGDVECVPSGPINFIKVPLLIPDYHSLSLLIDGRVRDYERSYINSLSSPAAVELFASILGILYMGGNVVMYFPEENTDLNYSDVLLIHIQKTYGITVESRSTAYMYDTRYDNFNARLLFLYNIITPLDYIMMVDNLTDVDINKLKDSPLMVEWQMPINIDNANFVRILGEKKNQFIQYGHVLEPVMTKLETGK